MTTKFDFGRYTEEPDSDPKKLNNHFITSGDDDDLPSPSFEGIDNNLKGNSLVGYDDGDEVGEEDENANLDFYQQLESIGM